MNYKSAINAITGILDACDPKTRMKVRATLFVDYKNPELKKKK